MTIDPSILQQNKNREKANEILVAKCCAEGYDRHSYILELEATVLDECVKENISWPETVNLWHEAIIAGYDPLDHAVARYAFDKKMKSSVVGLEWRKVGEKLSKAKLKKNLTKVVVDNSGRAKSDQQFFEEVIMKIVRGEVNRRCKVATKKIPLVDIDVMKQETINEVLPKSVELIREQVLKGSLNATNDALFPLISSIVKKKFEDKMKEL